jgi:tight adherence protein B
MLAAVVIMVFLVVFGLTISATYFLVEAPASRKRVRLRVEAVRQSAAGPMVTAEGLVFRESVLSGLPFVDRFLFEVPGIRSLQRFVQQSGLSLTVGRLLLISLALALCGGLAGLLLELPWGLTAALMVLPASIPFVVVATKRYQRLSKFEELFPDAMDLLARAVRAGHAFTTALELIATEMPEPLASEFRTTYDQQNLGLPLRDALYNLTVRVPSPDVRIFVTALQIQRESGGNLAEILDNLSYVVRERFKLYRQIRTLTAEGRISMYFLMGLPPLTALGLGIVNPDYLTELFVDPLGHKMLMAGVVMQTIGYFVIRKIIRMKV